MCSNSKLKSTVKPSRNSKTTKQQNNKTTKQQYGNTWQHNLDVKQPNKPTKSAQATRATTWASNVNRSTKCKRDHTSNNSKNCAKTRTTNITKTSNKAIPVRVTRLVRKHWCKSICEYQTTQPNITQHNPTWATHNAKFSWSSKDSESDADDQLENTSESRPLPGYGKYEPGYGTERAGLRHRTSRVTAQNEPGYGIAPAGLRQITTRWDRTGLLGHSLDTSL